MRAFSLITKKSKYYHVVCANLFMKSQEKNAQDSLTDKCDHDVIVYNFNDSFLHDQSNQEKEDFQVVNIFSLTQPSYCFTTAFRDLNRENWEHFDRTVDDYFTRFEQLLCTDIPLVVFIDQRVEQRATSAIKRSREGRDVYTVIIPMSDQFLQKYIHAYEFLDKEKEIMANTQYQEKVKHRIHHPENSVAEYNIINHAKIDFVNFVIKRIHTTQKCEKYGWIDFGYIEQHVVPFKNNLDTNKLDHRFVNFVVIDHPSCDDKDILTNLVKAPDRFAGAFFAGGPEIISEYQKQYHKMLHIFRKMNVADDDQAVSLLIYANSPQLFKLNLGSWKSAFEVFGK